MTHCVPFVRAAGAALALATLLAARPAAAVDLLGFYVGAGIGQGQVETGAPDITTASFKENHSAWKLMAGVRPLSLLGAELSYVDFGHPDGTLAGAPASARLDGVAGFGLLYLPIPLPFLDVYGKAGAARLRSSVQGTAPTLGAFRSDSTDTRFAAGIGAQFKFGSLAVRGEYERFDVSGGTPGLFTVGLTKTLF